MTRRALMLFLAALLLNPVAAMAQDNALVSLLTSQLGVSGEQASGGAGSLFSLAKDTLGKQDFAELSSMVPGMDSLLSAAPEVGGGGGGLNKLMGSAGGAGKALSGAGDVYKQFKELGLGTENITQYVNVIQGYLESEGGQAAVDLFDKGISALL